jgi:hypothetical protein
MKDAIELAKEAEFDVQGERVFSPVVGGTDIFWLLERLIQLARADEREQGQKWFDAVTEQHKAGILVERSANIACIGRIAAMTVDPIDRARLYEAMEAIQARGNQ